MSHKARNWISHLAPWLLISGLLLVGLSVYSHFSANHLDENAPAPSTLAKAEGMVIAGRETTVEHKKPDGSISHTEQYYELDLKPATGGSTLLLRLHHGVDKDVLSQLLETQVSVAYDPHHANTTYSIQKGGADVVRYKDIVALQHQGTQAHSGGISLMDYAGMLGAAILLLLGIGGLSSLRRSPSSAKATTTDKAFRRSRSPATNVTDFSEATPSEIQLARDEADDGSLISIQGQSLLVDTQIGPARYY